MSHAKKSTNPDEFILPDLGEGVAEAELIKWRVSEGQAVKEHDVLADMETDKALVEVPSPRDGVIATLHGSEGQIIKVGAVLVTFQGAAAAGKTGGGSGDSAGKAATPPAAPASSTTAPTKPAKSTPETKPAASPGCDMGAQVASGVEGSSNGTAEHREDAGTVVGAVGGALAGLNASPGKALATPAVRRLARDLGVDIDSVQGSGIGGRVLEKDVRDSAAGGASGRGAGVVAARSAPQAPVAPKPAPAAAAGVSAPRSAVRSTPPASSVVPASASAPGETTRIPFRGVRRTIGARLRESIDTAVHFTVMDEADVTALDALRRKLAAASGEKVSFLPFVASAVCRALTGEFGALNSTSDLRRGEDGSLEGEIIRHRAVHLGVATDTDNGLMVPVVRDCDKLGVLEISRHITHAAEAARSRTAPREMLSGSTITISNVGSHAGRFATPVINYPEVAILAVGRARDGVVVRGGGIAVGRLLPLSLACDHRIVDGAQAALCLARIVSLLQDDPESLLGPARG
jgi:pyruvate dehydrogenase E2 component (dihydrolipoamide acetyltransferase)